MAEITACESSLAAGELQFGTAPTTNSWIALEYRETWEYDAVAGSALPSAIKHLLKAQESLLPQLRIQLIRQPERKAGEPIRLYFARTSEGNNALYRLDLADYHDLAFIDFQGLYKGDTTAKALQIHEPLVLVCTHGKRDVCCALHGVGVYQALRAELGDQVWQTSHIGGHRFAGTLVTLPSGLYYGRVRPGDAPALAERIVHHGVSVPHLRGRSGLSDVVQAGEYFIRNNAENGTALELGESKVEQLEQSVTRVTFMQTDGSSRTVLVQRVISDFVVKTDSPKPETKTVAQFVQVDDDPQRGLLDPVERAGDGLPPATE